MFNVSDEEMDTLVCEVFDYLRFKLDQHDVRKLNVFMAIHDFGEIFETDNGLRAMMDFYNWAIKEERELSWIMADIMHDINGRNDKFMLPRTSGYLGKE